ncbi:MAG: sugar transferase [Planctomycetota bacterium]|nr:sugar transferase [Planctomycetota bacterium]
MTSAAYNMIDDARTRALAGNGPLFRAFKRSLDIAVASVVLLLTAPLLLVCIAWIRSCDGGPAIYRQWRVGRGGWLFVIYKLRTMRSDAESNGQARLASSGDPRILPGCAWMRKSHVDELPQLWNILRGQMSLVGPRPERPEILEELRTNIPRIDLRLADRPGLTGLAQVRNGYANDLAGARRKLALDIRYLRGRSFVSEIRLLLATVPKIWDRSAL